MQTPTPGIIGGPLTRIFHVCEAFIYEAFKGAAVVDYTASPWPACLSKYGGQV